MLENIAQAKTLKQETPAIVNFSLHLWSQTPFLWTIFLSTTHQQLSTAKKRWWSSPCYVGPPLGTAKSGLILQVVSQQRGRIKGPKKKNYMQYMYMYSGRSQNLWKRGSLSSKSHAEKWPRPLLLVTHPLFVQGIGANLPLTVTVEI